MTNRLWTSLAALGLTIAGDAQAGDTPLLGDAARRSSPSLFADAAYRQKALASVLDEYTPSDSDEAGWVGLTSKEVGLAFRRADADSVARGRRLYRRAEPGAVQHGRLDGHRLQPAGDGPRSATSQDCTAPAAIKTTHGLAHRSRLRTSDSSSNH